MALKVLGTTISPYSRKVAALCAEKQLSFAVEPVTPFAAPPNWREISPLGKIPALEHDGKIINDSSAICGYLERRFPTPALYPTDPYEYGRALWFEEYVDSALMSVFGPKVFWPAALQPVLENRSAEPAALEQAAKAMHEEVNPLLAYLEKELGGRDHFCGGALSIADLAIASFFVNARHAGFPPEASRFPGLARFVARMHARPSFAGPIAEERKVLTQRWA